MKRIERLKSKGSLNSAVVHERTKQEREEKSRFRLAPFFILILFGGLTYLLLFSGAFEVKNVKVVGYSNPALIEEIVESHTSGAFLKNNIFFFDKDKLIDAIKGDSGIRGINISKIYPNSLKIEIEESTPVVIWNSKGENYEIDERGYVIGKNSDKEIPVVNDLLNIEPSLGERVASPTFINYIIKLDENFEPITGAKIDKIYIYDILSDVRVKSVDSWTAYFNSSKDPVSQLENLNKVITEATETGSKRLEYIDMRLETRIFYK
jgi:cell division septal protein FtsQ